MADHHDEQEQIDELKRWWKENGTFVTFGLLIGVAAIAGWRGWQAWERQQAEEASAVYAALGRAVDQRDATAYQALADGLVRDHAGTPYAANGALLVARAEVEAGALDEAEARLAWAVANSRDAELALVARVRLARIQIALDKAEVALATLGAVPAGPFAPAFDEVRGDALVALGRSDEARAAYRSALAGAEDGRVDRDALELKLHDLGEAAPVAPAAAPGSAPGTQP